jgi:hypothetical protein
MSAEGMRMTLAPMRVVERAPHGRMDLRQVIDIACDMVDVERAGVRAEWTSFIADHVLPYLRDHQTLRDRLREVEVRRA